MKKSLKGTKDLSKRYFEMSVRSPPSLGLHHYRQNIIQNFLVF
jgi:hypothetical protein